MELETEKDRGGYRKAGDSDSGLGLTQQGTWLSSSALPSSLAEWLPLRLRDLGGSAAPYSEPAALDARRLFGGSGGGGVGDDGAGIATPDSSYERRHRHDGAAQTPPPPPRLHGDGGRSGGDRPARWSTSTPSADWSPAATAGGPILSGVGLGIAGQAGVRDALADSESRRAVLLDKLKEAQETLRAQSARLAKVETAYHNATFEVEELKHKEMVARNKAAELEKQIRDHAKHRSDEVAIQAALHNQIHEMEAGFQKFVSDYQLLEVDHSRRRELVEQLTTTIELVEDENRKLHKGQTELANDVRQMQQQLASLTEERKSLQTQLESSKRDAAHWRQELEDCQRTQKSADETVSELRIKVATMNHKLESLDQSHDALHKEKLSSQHRERELTEAITDLKSKLAILTSDKERYTQEKGETLRKMDTIASLKTEAEKTVDTLKNQLSTTSTELRIKQDLLIELQERHHRLQEEEVASQKVAEKLSVEVTRIKELLEREQEEKLALRRSSGRLAEDNASLEEAVAKLKRENAAGKSEMECLQAAYAQEKQKWDDAADKLQTNVRKLQKEAAEREEIGADLLSKLKLRETESARQLAQLSDEAQQWRARFESAQASMQRKEDEVGLMAHKIKELELELSRLDAELHTKQMEYESSSQMREELQRLQVLNKRLQLEKAENEQVVQLLQTQRDIYARSVSEHASKAHEIQTKADSIKLIEEDSLKNRIKAEELQKQLHILLSQKDELLSKAQEADDIRVKMEEESARSAERLAAATQRLEQLERANAALSSELNAFRDAAPASGALAAERQASAESRERLAAEVRLHQHEAATRASELAAVRLELDALRAEKLHLEERCAALLQSARANDSSSQAAAHEAARLAVAAGQLEAERATLEGRCRSLDAELQSARRDFAEQSGALRASLAESRQETASWSAECGRLRAEAARAAELQQRLAAAERAVGRLEEEAAAAAEREANDADRSAAERQAAVEELADAMAGRAALERACSDLRAQLEAAGARLGTAATAAAASEDAAEKRRSQEAEIEALRAQCEQQQADLALQADVLSELRLVKERCESLQADLSVSGELSGKELSALRDGQRQALRDNESLALQVEELEQAVERSEATARAELRRRDEAIEDLEDELRRLEQRRERALEDARRAQDELDEALDELKRSRDGAEQLLQEKAALLLDKSSLQQEVAGLTLRVAAAEAKLLERVDNESKITSLRNQLTASENQKSQAEAQLGRLQTEIAILKRDSTAQIDAVTRQNSENLSDLQSSMWQLREELKQSHDIQERQEDLIATLQEEINLLRKYEHESRELREKLRVVTEKSAAHADAASAQSLNKLLSAKDDELQQLHQSMSKASAELAKRDENIEKLQLKIVQLESADHRTSGGSSEQDPHSTLALARRLEDGLRQQILGRASLEPGADEAQSLRQQLTRTTAELNAVVSTKRALQSQVTELKMDVFRLQKDKETLERTSCRVQDTLTSSQELLRTMTAELDATKQRCAAAESQCERLRSVVDNVGAVAEVRPEDGRGRGRQRDAGLMPKAAAAAADFAGLEHSRDAAARTDGAVRGPAATAAAAVGADSRRAAAQPPPSSSTSLPTSSAATAAGGPVLTRGQTLRIFKQLKKGKRSRASAVANRKSPRLVVSEAYGGGDGAARRRDSFEARAADDEDDLNDAYEVDALKDTIVNNSGKVEWRGDPRAHIKQFSSSYDLSSISDEEDAANHDGDGGGGGGEEDDDDDDGDFSDDGVTTYGGDGGSPLDGMDADGGRQSTRRADYGTGNLSERDSSESDSPRSARSPRSDWRRKFADAYRQHDGSTP